MRTSWPHGYKPCLYPFTRQYESPQTQAIFTAVIAHSTTLDRRLRNWPVEGFVTTSHGSLSTALLLLREGSRPGGKRICIKRERCVGRGEMPRGQPRGSEKSGNGAVS